MGLGSSKFEKDLLGTDIPESERFFGLENFGNTCYCNSVLQALYFCTPFRNSVLKYYFKNNLNVASTRRNMEDNLFLTLADLFVNISMQKKRSGYVQPKRFVDRLRFENEIFRGHMHQDAHEFLNVLLNSIAEYLQKQEKQKLQQQQRLINSNSTNNLNGYQQQQQQQNGYNHNSRNNSYTNLNSSSSSVNNIFNNNTTTNSSKLSSNSYTNSTSNHNRTNSSTSENISVAESTTTTNTKINNHNSNGGNNQSSEDIKTFIHEIFEGILTNETKCLTCENVTNKDESFLDLSIDIDQNTSITSCLSNFSSVEILSKNDKFYCDKCISLQEAQKRMKIKKLPNTLIIHLKRFKFIEQIQQYKKLNYRVVFPFEIIVQNTVSDIEDPDKKYHLFAVVIHSGNGPNHGHYTSMIKSNGYWIGFDDENMGIIPESDIFDIFGSSSEYLGRNECGYLLFYQSESSLNEEEFKPPHNTSYAPTASTFTNFFYGGGDSQS